MTLARLKWELSRTLKLKKVHLLGFGFQFNQIDIIILDPSPYARFANAPESVNQRFRTSG